MFPHNYFTASYFQTSYFLPNEDSIFVPADSNAKYVINPTWMGKMGMR